EVVPPLPRRGPRPAERPGLRRGRGDHRQAYGREPGPHPQGLPLPGPRRPADAGRRGPSDRVVARPEAGQDAPGREGHRRRELPARGAARAALTYDLGRPVTISIKKLLIANRGEIAVRVIRACRELGIATVAVFSEADREAPHVLLADESYPIGPPPAAESYLAIDKLVAVARSAGADAVHPGYGFLAENARFAEACTQAGLTFVGPPPAAIRTMGDKTSARKIARDLKVPMVPGTLDPISSDDEARTLSRQIGYP